MNKNVLLKALRDLIVGNEREIVKLESEITEAKKEIDRITNEK